MMKLPFEISVALRYMMSRRKDAFVSLITMISTGGIALGVAALIVVLSVMNGMRHDLKQKILGTNAHVILLRSGGGIAAHGMLAEELANDFKDDVVATTPFIYNQGMLTSRANVVGTVVRGVDLDSVTAVTKVQDYVLSGSLQSLRTTTGVQETDALAVTAATIEDVLPDLPGIAIGKELAINLAVRMGDTVNLLSPTGEVTPFGTAPRIRQYEVRMIFSTGMFEYDSALAYVSLQEAQDFYDMEGLVTGLEIKLKNPDVSDLVSGRISGQLGFPYYTRDWKEMNRNLFSALELEKIAMSIILFFIVLVAAFNIVSTLFMVVLEKGRDIAILKSMGATATQIRNIFVLEGVIIGTIGSILGMGLGVSLALLLDKYQFIQLPKDIYYIDRLPVRMVGWEIAAIVAGTLLISVLATLYPASRGARLDPAEGIRYGVE